MFENYEQFLDILMQDLDAMFEHQKDYICCKEGCSYCCENGEYPFTELEFKYLMQEFENLDEHTKTIVKNNIKNISPDENGYYVCPFLINKRCSVYKNRGIVCRTFGLINKDEDGKVNGPFCGKLGLNYSEVYDKDSKELLMDVIKEKQYRNLPRIFDLSITNIRKLDLVKQLGIEFGYQRALKDWLDDYENRK